MRVITRKPARVIKRVKANEPDLSIYPDDKHSGRIVCYFSYANSGAAASTYIAGSNISVRDAARQWISSWGFSKLVAATLISDTREFSVLYDATDRNHYAYNMLQSAIAFHTRMRRPEIPDTTPSTKPRRIIRR